MENAQKTEWCRTGRAFTAPRRYGITLSALMVMSVAPGVGLAQTSVPGFDFTFKPLDSTPENDFPTVTCSIPGLPDHRCDPINAYNWGPSLDDGTSFSQERVNIGGVDYYHLVVGQPEQGFAQEILIRAGNGSVLFDPFFRATRFGPVLSQSGGGFCLTGNGPFEDPKAIPVCVTDNNANTPFSTFNITGNGSGNPEAVLIKQIMSDSASGFSQEFLKAQLDKKPVISQNMNYAGVANTFVLDMSASGYKEATQGKMTNITEVEGVGKFDADAGFGGSNEASGKFISGGRYTFSADASLGKEKTSAKVIVNGLESPNGPFKYGTYTYYDDATDPTKGRDFDFGTANLGTPIDPAQNPASSLRGLPP